MPRVIVDETEVSTFQAAEILNVSRPYVIKVLDAGTMPHRMVGSHRRMRLADVLSYKAKQDAIADAVLAELTAQAQELKLGY